MEKSKRISNWKMQKKCKRRITMEFEKVKKIIVEVLNVEENDITMDTTFSS